MNRPPSDIETLRPVPTGLTVLAIARAQLGKGEIGGKGLGPIVRWSIEHWPSDPAAGWAAGFVCTCFLMAGYVAAHQFGTLSGDVLYGRCFEAGYLADEPQAGDVVFFKHDAEQGVASVGLVELVGDSAVQAIQGDKDGEVRRCGYYRDDARILGYARIPHPAVRS